MSVSPDAWLGAGTTVLVVLGGGIWKLATMLAEVRAQVRHNGGSSLKDDAKGARLAAEVGNERTARLEARFDALEVAQAAAGERAAERQSELRASMAKVQHDVSAVRTGLALHVYEAQLAQAAYRNATGHHDLPRFTTPEGSPLPNPDL